MTDVAKELEENGYLYLPNFIDKDSCKLMAESMIKSVAENKGIKDGDCPLSYSFHGGFDAAQKEIHPHLEKLCAKNLLKTYNYCRLYQPGEVLDKHIDREACEYSITLTLGFDGEPWPLFLEDAKGREVVINASVGDAVFYKGKQRPHWREKYTQGKWQAQVFFHFVDMDGPYWSSHFTENAKIYEYLFKK